MSVNPTQSTMTYRMTYTIVTMTYPMTYSTMTYRMTYIRYMSCHTLVYVRVVSNADDMSYDMSYGGVSCVYVIWYVIWYVMVTLFLSLYVMRYAITTKWLMSLTWPTWHIKPRYMSSRHRDDIWWYVMRYVIWYVMLAYVMGICHAVFFFTDDTHAHTI